MLRPFAALATLLVVWCAVAARAADAPVSTTERLEAAQNAVALASVNLSAIPPAEAATYGGHLADTLTLLHALRDEFSAALAALPANTTAATAPPPAVSPPAPSLPALSSSNGPNGSNPPAAPALPRTAFYAPRTPLVEAVDALNAALNALLADPATPAAGLAPLPGVPATRHARIVTLLGHAGEAISVGVEFHNTPPPRATSSDPEQIPPLPPLHSIAAACALSLGLSLLGLHVFSRRKI